VEKRSTYVEERNEEVGRDLVSLKERTVWSGITRVNPVRLDAAVHTSLVIAVLFKYIFGVRGMK
jgi:hypothetical protein